MKTENDLQELVTRLVDCLGDGVRVRNELLNASELRIDATNKMINNLVDAIARMHTEYDQHLRDVTHCRDSLMRQNEKLMNEVARVSRQKEELISLLSEKDAAMLKLETEWRVLLRDMVVSGRPQTNINV